MRTTVFALVPAVLAGSLLVAPAAMADTGTTTTPLGTLELTVDGGSFTEECTDFPYEVVVTGASADIQWSAEVDAEGSRGATASAMSTGMGSGSGTDSLMICSSHDTGHGTWTADVAVMMRDTMDTTKVYNTSITVTFKITKAESVATVTDVIVKESKDTTKVKGTVIDVNGHTATTMFGYVKIKVKKPGWSSWKEKGEGQVSSAGSYAVTLSKAYESGTKIKVKYKGSDEAKKATSAVWTIS